MTANNLRLCLQKYYYNQSAYVHHQFQKDTKMFLIELLVVFYLS